MQVTAPAPSSPVPLDGTSGRGMAAVIKEVHKTLASHEETVRRVLILTALYAIPAVAVTKPIIDPDIWWHLRTGQWIVEHGTVPMTDPFSSYGMGKPWIAYSWLFEVLVYGLYSRLGLMGIILYRVVFFLAVAAVVHRLVAKREPRFVVAIGTVGFAMLAIGPLFTERPWLFTILFLTLTLDAVLDCRAGTRTRMFWLVPPLYAFWANVHIQFVYGLLILALACTAPLLDRLLGRSEQEANATTAGSQGWWRLVALAGACAAATLLNPYHVRIYSVVIEYATQHAPYLYIQELTALDFRQPSDWAVLAITGAAAFALGRRAKFPTFEALFLVAGAYFAFHAKREAWFVVMAAIVLLTAARSTTTLTARFTPTRSQVLLVAGAVVAALIIVGRIRHISEYHLEAALAEKYPVAAAAVVEERGYRGPLYNHFNWGGYLIWRLRDLPVAMDGRTNVHGDDRIERSLQTWAGKNSWASDPELAAARLVISGVDWPLASLLRLDSRFELVYGDAVAVVFITHPQREVREID